jgi:hypothetical protein
MNMSAPSFNLSFWTHPLSKLTQRIPDNIHQFDKGALHGQGDQEKIFKRGDQNQRRDDCHDHRDPELSSHRLILINKPPAIEDIGQEEKKYEDVHEISEAFVKVLIDSGEKEDQKEEASDEIENEKFFQDSGRIEVEKSDKDK